MNNLKKFSSETEYNAATLNYPAVSWVTATDNVHFDKSGSTPTVNDKVMMAWTTDNHGYGDIALANLASVEPTTLFTSITVNDVEVLSLVGSSGVLGEYAQANTDYVAKYALINNTAITDIFSGDLGGAWGSATPTVDFLIPAQVTSIESLPSDVVNLVVEAATPPTASLNWSSFSGTIYVPDSAVNAYKTAWSSVSSYILPISEYQGNLPV